MDCTLRHYHAVKKQREGRAGKSNIVPLSIVERMNTADKARDVAAFE
jgi:hypothetical protein